jgi:hypothetical protein
MFLARSGGSATGVLSPSECFIPQTGAGHLFAGNSSVYCQIRLIPFDVSWV